MRSPWAHSLTGLAAAFAALGCGAESTSALDIPRLGDPVQVVPGDGLPPEVALQNANNNLDVVRHQGRVYLVFRTAPLHFASAQTVLYVVSSEDQRTWTFEAQVARRTDLREPRLLSWRGRLWLYFAVLGHQPARFEPDHAEVMERHPDGTWSAPTPFYEEGFIPWRMRVHDDRAWMIGYTGGDGIYEMDRGLVRIHWLASDDGDTWTAASGADPVVLEGGGSEADFAFLPNGGAVMVVRNESGDADGWGSKVCRAEEGALGAWRCETDLRKYDSPLLIGHGDAVWLIGRRNLTDTGHYDLGGEEKSHAQRSFDNQTGYWLAPKRCSVWRVDPLEPGVEFAADLPSRGDTCFASVLQPVEEGGPFDLYNYTSPLDGPDVAWQEGQNGPTVIYRMTLSLPTR